MLEILTKSRLGLSVILLAYPVGFTGFYLIRGIEKVIKGIRNKVDEMKSLDKFRNDLHKKLAEETQGTNEEEGENVVEQSDDKIVKAILEDDPISKKKDTGFVLKPKTEKQQSQNIDIEKHQKLLDKILYEAHSLKDKGKLDQYEKKLIEGLALDAEHPEFLKLLGEYYFSLGNHKKAFTLLKKILEKKPDDHKSIRQIGEIYLAKGEFETAELLVQKSINLQPNDPKYYVSLVEIKYNTGKKEEAAGLMEKVIKLRPSNVNYLLALAKLYEEITDYQNAKKYYFKILEIDPLHTISKNKIQSL